MSTRRSLFIVGPVHVFYDVVAGAYYVDVGRDAYNRAYRLWPIRGAPFRLY